jgi:hypothetical protein
MTKPIIRWGVLWRSKNRLDGVTERLMFKQGIPALFRKRCEAKAWIDEYYGYIRDDLDVRREPHGWRMPIPVRVKVERI